MTILRVNQLTMAGAILQTSFIWKYFYIMFRTRKKKNEVNFLFYFLTLNLFFVAVNLNCSGEQRVTI